MKGKTILMYSSEKKWSFIVTSSNGYSDLVSGFIKSSKLFFPDLDIKFYFALENDTFESCENFVFLTTGFKKWSQRLYAALMTASSDYVVVVPEDLYFMHKVYLEDCINIIEYVIHNDVDYMGYSKDITEDFRFLESKNQIDYFELINPSRFTPYIVASSGIYKKSFLMNLLRKNEDIWEFEHSARFRVNIKKSRIISFNKNGINPLAHYSPGIILRGELTTEGLEYLKLNNIELIWKTKPTINLVTTEKDGLFKRLSRIPKRYAKILLNLFFFKFN
jgi:hypothetical protein